MKGYDTTNSREHCNSISSGDGGRRRSDAYSLQSSGRGCDAVEGGYHGTGAKRLVGFWTVAGQRALSLGVQAMTWQGVAEKLLRLWMIFG